MNYFTIYGAALLLALLIASPALDKFNLKAFGDWKPKPWRSLLSNLWASELGVVSVTYYIRGGAVVINGSLTPPTQTQANQVMKQSAVVEFSVVGDIATALFTHNWGLDISAAGFFEPEILVEPISMATTSWPLFTFWRSTSNVIQINRPTTDLPTTILVTLRRPHSMGQ
jgi:hypothetical protein